MTFHFHARRNGYFRIGVTLAIVAAVAILFEVLGTALISIWDLIQHEPIAKTDSFVLLIATSVAQIVVMIFGTIYLVRIFGLPQIRSLRLQGFYDTPAWIYLLALPLVYATQLTGSMLAVLWEHFLQTAPSIYTHVQKLEQVTTDISDAIGVGRHTTLGAVVVFLAVGVVPGIAEELLFRGFMQSNIELSGKGRTRPYVAIAWTSMTFAAIHFEPVEFPGLLLLGLVFGWISYRTGNLLVGSLSHVANNASIVLVMLLLPGAEGAAITSTTGRAMSISEATDTLVIALPALVGLLWIFYTATRPLTARQPPAQLFEANNKQHLPIDLSSPNATHDV